MIKYKRNYKIVKITFLYSQINLLCYNTLKINQSAKGVCILYRRLFCFSGIYFDINDRQEGDKMDSKVSFLYLSEPDMIKAGVTDMKQCMETMEDMLVTLKKGDYIMAGQNHNSHGAQLSFPDHPKFPGMPKNADDRRFMAMPAYLGGKTQMAGMKWYGSNVENKKQGLPRSILMMMLNDKDTGAPLAMMSANLVSSYRTGAIPGVGAKYLAKKDAASVGIIGPGVMGKTSLKAFICACPGLDTVYIKGRGKRSLDSFLQFVKEECPVIKKRLSVRQKRKPWETATSYV